MTSGSSPLPSTSPSSSSLSPQMPLLRFAPLQSLLSPDFWERLAALKVELQRLDDSAFTVRGFYQPSNHSHVASPLSLSHASLPTSQEMVLWLQERQEQQEQPSQQQQQQPQQQQQKQQQQQQDEGGQADGQGGGVSHGKGQGKENSEDGDNAEGHPPDSHHHQQRQQQHQQQQQQQQQQQAGMVCVGGEMRNLNTAESFRNLDRAKVLKEAGNKVWQAIQSGAAERDPSLLCGFAVMSYADVKRWRFTFTCAFPAIVMPTPATLLTPPLPASQLFDSIAPGLADKVAAACGEWRTPPQPQTKTQGDHPPVSEGVGGEDGGGHLTGAPFFLLHIQRGGSLGRPLSHAGVVHGAPLLATAAGEAPPSSGRAAEPAAELAAAEAAAAAAAAAAEHVVCARPLHHWTTLQEEMWKDEKCQQGAATAAKSEEELVVVFCDPCNLPANPGWWLRNLLALAVVRWRRSRLRVLCYRERRGRFSARDSPVFDVALPEILAWRDTACACPAVAGWEANAQGKQGPRVADLGPAMDPIRLADAAATLNLQLMRWRMLPSLDLQRLAAIRCLLLGAGTLGCHVARGLMAWGVRHVTLVDYGRVAYSNPVRQPLFTFADCADGGRPKAEAAADALRRILPTMRAEGVKLAIPMPGHSVGHEEAEVARARHSVERLQRMVREHDAVFLLTDTRESRWLPTLLCAVEDKIAINAALGFDTFLVMRHGQRLCHPHPHSHTQPTAAANTNVSHPSSRSSSSRLGCYFCNDVVAPLDSTANQTLDQQCTVTRPGVAAAAGALAVELLVALLHHPMGNAAPAPSQQQQQDEGEEQEQQQHATGEPARKAETSQEVDENAVPTASERGTDKVLSVRRGKAGSRGGSGGGSGGGEAEEGALGLIPHQLRGWLSTFSQLSVVGHAFDQCTACSPTVVEEFERSGFEFVARVLDEPKHLEDLTGLTRLLADTADLSLDWDDDDDDNDDDEEDNNDNDDNDDSDGNSNGGSGGDNDDQEGDGGGEDGTGSGDSEGNDDNGGHHHEEQD